MSLLSDIKQSMRIKHNELDSTLQNDINSGTLDMIRVGIQPYKLDANGDYVIEEENKALKDDALISKAIELYCKGEEDYNGKGTQYTAAYEKLRDALSLCDDYKEVQSAE